MARISPIPTSPRRARSTRSLEIRRLKLARLPPCSELPIAPLPSISLIPSARLKLACFPTRSPPPRGFTFYLADPISSIAQISADSDSLNQEKMGEGVETRSAPAVARCYPRSLTFYLGNPFPRLKLARLPLSLAATLAA